MKRVVRYAKIVVIVNVVNMIQELLNKAVCTKSMKGVVEFVVMNSTTATNLLKELCVGIEEEGTRLKSYKNYEILISNTLKDNEFRIG